MHNTHKTTPRTQVISYVSYIHPCVSTKKASNGPPILSLPLVVPAQSHLIVLFVAIAPKAVVRLRYSYVLFAVAVCTSNAVRFNRPPDVVAREVKNRGMYMHNKLLSIKRRTSKNTGTPRNPQ